MTKRKTDTFSHEGSPSEPGEALARVRQRLTERGFEQEHPPDGQGWFCIVHKERENEASISVKPGNEVDVVINCAVCGQDKLLAFLDLKLADLHNKPAEKVVGRGKRLSTKHYVYKDERGEPLFRVKKTEYENTKTFTQERAGGNGGWIVKGIRANKAKGIQAKSVMDGVRRVLYGLPELVRAVGKGKVIHLTEGEKDADALNAWFVEHEVQAFATCHPGGAGKWATYEDYAPSLAGAAAVVVWADRDAKGYACAAERLQAVLAAGLTAHAVLPAPIEEKADAFDHLAVGHAPHDALPVTLEELLELSEKGADKAAFAAETWDDFGNAQRLVDRYADRLRYVTDNDRWAVYDQKTGLWIPRGADARASGLARKTVERMAAEEAPNYSAEPGSGGSENRSLRQDWFKWVDRNRKDGPVRAMVSQARSKKSLHAKLNDFDANPDMLHCANGVLNLRTVQLEPHSPAHLCTVSTDTEYLESAEHDLWDSYLDLFVPDLEIRRYLQRLLGYCLLDGNPERLFVMVVGGTSTGKTTLNEILLATLGDYAKPFNLSVFRSNQNEKPRSDIAGVLNRRYISAVEASAEWHLHADQVKKISGGDTLAARFPHDKVDTVRVPAFVPFMFTNAFPTIDGRDLALDKRLVVLPFRERVSDDHDDRQARDVMAHSSEVQSAVLAWAVQGLRGYRNEGMGKTPDAILVATQEARRELSDLDRWLHEACEFDEEFRAKPQELYDKYRQSCEFDRAREADILTLTAFGRGLSNRGYERKQAKVKKTPTWFRFGLRLKTSRKDR